MKPIQASIGLNSNALESIVDSKSEGKLQETGHQDIPMLHPCQPARQTSIDPRTRTRAISGAIRTRVGSNKLRKLAIAY